MLAAQGDPNVLDDKGNTPLHYAAALGDKKILKMLLATRLCYTTIRNTRGKTPGEIAIAFGGNERDELIKLFMASEKIPPEGFLESQNELRLEKHAVWERRGSSVGAPENGGEDAFTEKRSKHQQLLWRKEREEKEDLELARRREESARNEKYEAILRVHRDIESFDGFSREQLETLGNIFRKALEEIDTHLGNKVCYSCANRILD